MVFDHARAIRANVGLTPRLRSGYTEDNPSCHKCVYGFCTRVAVHYNSPQSTTKLLFYADLGPVECSPSPMLANRSETGFNKCTGINQICRARGWQAPSVGAFRLSIRARPSK